MESCFSLCRAEVVQLVGLPLRPCEAPRREGKPRQCMCVHIGVRACVCVEGEGGGEHIFISNDNGRLSSVPGGGVIGRCILV